VFIGCSVSIDTAEGWFGLCIDRGWLFKNYSSFYLGYCVVYSVIGFVSEKMNFWFWHFCKKVMIAHFGCCAKEP